MSSSFEIYKTQINLIDFVKVRYGFEINQKKSSKKQVVMFHPLKKQKIIISRNFQGQYWYFNPNNHEDKGTVIDFVLYRNNQNREETIDELNLFLNNAQVSTEILEIPIIANKPSFEVLPLTQTWFLERRGLKISTIFSKEFKDRIFNHSHNAGEANFVNIAFPIYQNNQIIGLELKNDNFKAYALHSRKSDGFWISNYQDLDKTLVTEFIISESAIDALSFHQLYSREKIQRVYISTGGLLTEGQKKELTRVIKPFKNAKIILANDNDLAGIRQNIELASAIAISDKSKRIAGKIISYTPTYCQFRLMISTGNIDLPFEVESVANMLKSDSTLQIENLSTSLKKENLALISLQMKVSRESLIRLESIIPMIRGMKNMIRAQRPQKKDFNEDLMSLDA